MADSIALGPDGQINHALAVLRGEIREGELADHVHFLPGIDLHADPEMRIAGRYNLTEGRLFDLEVRPGGQGSWCALHLSFPAPDMNGFGALGFALRGAAPEMQILRACIRSGVKRGFVDCFFDKHILMCPEESSHVDALPVQHRHNLPLQAPWREMILFLPAKAFDLSLIDLRVFLV